MPQLTITQKAALNGQAIAWPLLVFFLLSVLQTTLLNKTSLFLFIIYLLVKNYKSLLTISLTSLKAFGLYLILIWEIFSISWSKATIVSLIYVGNDIEILMFSILAAYHARDKDIAASLKLAAMVITTLVIIYCAIFPGESLTANGLKSFYNNKNNLGVSMGISAMIILFNFKNKKSDYIFIFLTLTLLILSQSKTSLNLFILIVFLAYFSQSIRSIYLQLNPYTQGFINLATKTLPFFFYVFIILLVLYRENVADFLMNSIPDEAITGRGLLWFTVLSRTYNDLLIGIGPGVFWGADILSEIVQSPLYEQGWVKELRAADGGYIDIIGSIGFIGLGLLLFSIVQSYRLAFNANSHPSWKLIFSLITFFVFHNVTETDVFRFANAPWFLFQFMTFYLIFTQPETAFKAISKRLAGQSISNNFNQ